MREWWRIAGAVVLVLVASQAWCTIAVADDVEIRILHTNDWHGQVRPLERTIGGSAEVTRTGGAVAVANAVERHRAEDSSALLVSAGDWFQGTPEGIVPRGRLMVDLMNALRYDAAVAGNHEFDLGEATLEDLAKRAQFPVLGSNIVGRADRRMRPYLTDTVIRDVKGVKVGITGLLLEGAAQVILAEHIKELDFAPEIETLERTVAALRQQGAEIVVVVNHIGAERNEQIIKEIPGIDVMIGGHRHATPLASGKMVGTTLIAQAMSNSRGLGVVRITWDSAARRVTGRSATIEPLEYDPAASNRHVDTVMARYRDQLALEIDGPLAFVEPVMVTEAMTRNRDRGVASPLGSWIADTIRGHVGADVGFMNKGGVRKNLVPGPVTVRDFWEVSPFGNTIVTMSLTGGQILELVAASFVDGTTHSGLDISGLRVLIPESEDLASVGSPQLSAFVGEEPLELDRRYLVATNSFLAGGGDGYDAFTRGTEVVNTGVLLREAEIAAARATRTISPPTDLRWTIVPAPRERSLVATVARGIFGLIALLGIAWLFSTNRSRFPWRIAIGGVVMQLVIGLFLIEWQIGFFVFQGLSDVVNRLLAFTNEGATFVFGSAVTADSNVPGLAFRALPTIIFFSCLMAILYHLRVMHLLIWCMAQVMTRVLGVTGAESMAVAANVFVGQTEAPLVVRRFLPNLTRSELASLMTGGFATVAGSVLAAYISFYESAGGGEYVPHLLIASVMSAPAAFAISKVLVPETEKSETGDGMSLEFKAEADNVLDAAATGVSEGLKLWLNVFAMLLAFVALVAMIDWPLTALGDYLGEHTRFTGGLSLSRIFGWIFYPIAFAMGVDTADCGRFGALLGTKVGINEFLAYLQLQQEIVYQANPQALAESGHSHALSKRTIFMATYALCGFANFSSMGIQIGGIAPLVPERRSEIIQLALRTMIGGALASWMTATIAGMFYS